MTRLVGALVFLPVILEAKIGETVAQCEARYGKADRVTNRESEHRAGGVSITCAYLEGKCISVRYEILGASFVSSKPEDTEPKSFSEEQVQLLLALNQGGSKWLKEEGEFRTGYRTADGRLHAAVIPGMFGGVRIETIESYRKRVADIQPQAVLKTIQQFSSAEKAGN